MRFSQFRRRRRRPKPPFFLLELNLSLDEIVADLVYPTPSASRNQSSMHSRAGCDSTAR
jgi:hypothetical protein